jgi:hypothetical protein
MSNKGLSFNEIKYNLLFIKTYLYNLEFSLYLYPKLLTSDKSYRYTRTPLRNRV